MLESVYPAGAHEICDENLVVGYGVVREADFEPEGPIDSLLIEECFEERGIPRDVAKEDRFIRRAGEAKAGPLAIVAELEVEVEVVRGLHADESFLLDFALDKGFPRDFAIGDPAFPVHKRAFVGEFNRNRPRGIVLEDDFEAGEALDDFGDFSLIDGKSSDRLVRGCLIVFSHEGHHPFGIANEGGELFDCFATEKLFRCFASQFHVIVFEL